MEELFVTCKQRRSVDAGPDKARKLAVVTTERRRVLAVDGERLALPRA